VNGYDAWLLWSRMEPTVAAQEGRDQAPAEVSKSCVRLCGERLWCDAVGLFTTWRNNAAAGAP
jgi:hypothetical protein